MSSSAAPPSPPCSISSNSNSSECLLRHAKLPNYLAHAFQDLYQEDGLAVLGRGLGLLHLIASFCRFYVDVEEGHYALMKDEVQLELEDVERKLKSSHRNADVNVAYNLNTGTGGTGRSTRHSDHSDHSTGTSAQTVQREARELQRLKLQLEHFLHRLSRNKIYTRNSEVDSYDEACLKKTKPPLVFVIGLRDHERQCLITILEQWGTPTELLPTEVTNENGSNAERSLLYSRGGVFLVTSRILIVDLLTHVASPRDIDGILVAHAEIVTEQSTEAFILRIFRTQKRFGLEQHSAAGGGGGGELETNSPMIQSMQYGFVKAFSDAPASLVSGFAKVDKILKALFVRRIYIYPRFHDVVSQELERTPPMVEELHQSLSPKMIEIQAAIAAAVKACIRELKKSVSIIDWTDAELTLENCVTTNFDLKISRQLDADWHRLKPATKQLVNDLKQLRTLFQYLLQYDCIAFWKLINSIKMIGASSRNPSMWLLSGAANVMFKIAKERMYTIVNGNKATKKNPIPVKKLIPHLEENPKWRLLHQVLSEIEKRHTNQMDAKRKTAKRNTTKNNDDNVNGTKYNDIGNRVLVMVKDERTLESVKSYLVDGREICMKKRWLRYLKQINDHTRSLAKGSNGGINQISEESRLLLEEEGKIRNFLFGNKQNDRESNNDEPRKRKTAMMNVIPSWKKKRRRIQEEKNRGSTLMETSEDRKQSAALDEAIEETENFEVEILSSTVFPDDDNQDYEMDEFEGLFHAEKIDDLRVMIHTYNNTEGEQAYLLLNDVRPDYIVLYDAEPSFIRSIEIHSATQSEHQLRVYFMLFEASSEEKNYLRAVEREQNAFERLIQHKKTMALPLNMLGPCSTQEMLLAGGNGVGGSYNSGSLPLSIDTRTGRGKKVNNEKRDIAVDVREFRSGLPSILHQGGMRLAPVTLTVGDFVLSNVHCVERKSISDLFGSFASGRLLTQAQQMSKHYKVPCLLIEFQPSKSFCLQNANEIGPDLRVDGVCGKMSLLMMHVPQLRFLWSRSPHETLKIFKSLKTNHEEVDVDKAVAIGSNESFDALLMQDDGEGGENGNTAAEVNEAAKEMLLKLPGITIHNARQVMNVCDSIAELANLPREKMKELLGARPGQNLFTFFHQTDY